MIPEFLFWASVFLLVHTYLFFPVVMLALGGRKKNTAVAAGPGENLPFVTVIIPAYNEEVVIGEKLESVFRSSLPEGSYEVLVGSDCSRDRTDVIVTGLSEKHPSLQLIRFSGRTGKPEIVNRLAAAAKGEVLVLTDANILFGEETMYHLVKYFADPTVGLVEGNITGIPSSEGLAGEESAYLSWEFKLKYAEGALWGATMGPLGGCYAVRKTLFTPVPAGFLVDDFFIAISVFLRGAAAVTSPEAVSREELSGSVREEFRRKVRIAAGNYQNLAYFFMRLSSVRWQVAFVFLSHKAIRWLSPFLLIILYFCSWKLSWNPWFDTVFKVGILFGGLAVAGLLLRLAGLLPPMLGAVTYFFVMNAALLFGFIRYLTGIKTNVWEPTKR